MKKYLKKISALLVAMAMVMTMCVTALAATDSATITVSEMAEGTQLTYMQVIVPAPGTTTGWAFVNENVTKAYVDAFGASYTDQAVIAELIAYVKGEAGTEGTPAKIGKALSNVAALDGFDAMTNPQAVTSAGVYAIKAAATGYTYNNMAAYVGFGEVTGEYEYPSLMGAQLTAKKSKNEVDKSNDDDDKAVAIGDTITYTITTNVPYINPNDTDKTFFIYDQITGADYDFTNASIKMGDKDLYGERGGVYFNQVDTEPRKFSIDLSHLIDDANSNAGQKIIVTYEAVIKEVDVNNRAAGSQNGSEYGSKTDNVYTGQITLTKYGETKAQPALEGAGFEVYKANLVVDENNKVTSYTKTSEALKFTKESDGVYVYSPNATEEEDYVTEVVTGAAGTVVVKGLDVGGYHFDEVTAPKGYSINADGANATLSVGETGATANFATTTDLTDTKLSALPSTGSIGTYLFTLIGVVIMATTAGIFFVKRRRNAK